MGNVYVYSFEDTTVTIEHPNLGSYSAYGTGIGTMAISYANDVTMHDVGADLAVVVSKSAKKNGTVTFEVLQTSDFSTWLKKWYNYVLTAPSESFAQASITIRNSSSGDYYLCTGVSPQKMADGNFQSQQQNRSWALMCANIETQ